MANTKSKSGKKKTTAKKKATSKKVAATKKKTITKTSSVPKKVSSVKKTTAKKTTTVKKPATKKSTAKQTTTKKSTTPKIKVTLKEAEKINIINTDEEVVLPKLKGETKEISKNHNLPDKVIKTEEFTKEKKEIDENNKVIKVEEYTVINKEEKNKKKTSKSKAEKISKNKKNPIIKKLNKLKRKIKMYGINSVLPIKYIILIIIIVALFMIVPTVYNKYFGSDAKMDLSSIPEKIDQLKTVSFSIDNVNDIVKSSEAFNGLKDYYEYDFESVFKLDKKYVDEYAIKYNKANNQVFIAIKATDGNHDTVKKIIDKFCEENSIKDYEYLEYQGYQIYIKSSNNSSVISKIKQSQTRVFNILQELKKDEIEKTTGVSDSYYFEALVKTAMLRSDVCEYAIFKPVNDHAKNEIKNIMENYYDGLESKWKGNSDNLKLIKNRHFEEYKGYLIYVISHNNDLVMDLIKSVK